MVSGTSGQKRIDAAIKAKIEMAIKHTVAAIYSWWTDGAAAGGANIC